MKAWYPHDSQHVGGAWRCCFMKLSASVSMWRHVLWWPMWSPWVFKKGVQKPKIAFSFHAISLTFWIILRVGQWTYFSSPRSHEPARSGFRRQCCLVVVNGASLHRVVSEVHYALCMHLSWRKLLLPSLITTLKCKLPTLQTLTADLNIQSKVPTTLWWSLTLN